MSWIDKILPPRIKREEGAARKTVPEGPVDQVSGL